MSCLLLSPEGRKHVAGHMSTPLGAKALTDDTWPVIKKGLSDRAFLKGKTMRVEKLDEPIRVRADFQAGEIYPLYFQRGIHRYRVLKVHTRWLDREGVFARIHFAIEARSEADSGTYEMHFNSKELSWYLDRVVV